MTIGPHAEYFSESERQSKNYLELPDDALALIETTRQKVGESQSADELREAIGVLNAVLYDMGLLGRTVRLTSDFSVVTTKEVRLLDTELQSVDEPELVSGESYNGVFLGCDAYSFNSISYELVYRLELPLDEDGLRQRTVVAATDISTIAVELDPMTVFGETDMLGAALDILVHNESPIVRDIVENMIEVIESSEEVDATMLRELAILATAALEQPTVADDMAMKNALTGMFSTFIDEGTVYAIEGYEFTAVKTAKGRDISLDELEARVNIHAVATTTDFDFISAKDNDGQAVLKTKPTHQPSFIVLDNDNVEHVFPIKWIKTFAISQYSPKTASCESARDSFLAEYPDLFDPDKRHKRDRYIVEKYFQNDADGV